MSTEHSEQFAQVVQDSLRQLEIINRANKVLITYQKTLRKQAEEIKMYLADYSSQGWADKPVHDTETILDFVIENICTKLEKCHSIHNPEGVSPLEKKDSSEGRI